MHYHIMQNKEMYWCIEHMSLSISCYGGPESIYRSFSPVSMLYFNLLLYMYISINLKHVTWSLPTSRRSLLWSDRWFICNMQYEVCRALEDDSPSIENSFPRKIKPRKECVTASVFITTLCVPWSSTLHFFTVALVTILKCSLSYSFSIKQNYHNRKAGASNPPLWVRDHLHIRHSEAHFTFHPTISRSKCNKLVEITNLSTPTFTNVGDCSPNPLRIDAPTEKWS